LPLGGYNRTSGRASCSFIELYCPMWCGESTEHQSCVSRGCVVSRRGTSRKNHMVGVLLSSIVFSNASIAPNSRCFEGLLLIFDSDYSGVWTLATDDHLPGMLPACKQLYFLGHLQSTIGDIVLDGLLPSCFLVGCALIVC
jgi:hypothetical protein